MNKELVVAVILARGGSKGIPSKNLIEFCGKPLMYWTVTQCLKTKSIDEVWVSSDSQEILSISSSLGAKTVLRPNNISTDSSTSESGWKHAIKHIEEEGKSISLVIAPQVTSPLREPIDIEMGIEKFYTEDYDSMFSCSEASDTFLWEEEDGVLKSANYNTSKRPMRQDIKNKYIENGSFYIFLPEVLKQFNNRFGNKIGYTLMESWKKYEIDELDDLKVCSAIMKEFLLDR